MANSVGPGETRRYAASDLGPYCSGLSDRTHTVNTVDKFETYDYFT